MKHIKIILSILFLFVLSIKEVYAEQLSFGIGIYNIATSNSDFKKVNEEGMLIENASFDQVSLNYNIKIRSHHQHEVLEKGNPTSTTFRDGMGNYSYMNSYSSSFATAPFFSDDREFISQSDITIKINGKNHKLSLRNYKMTFEENNLISADFLYDNKVLYFDIAYHNITNETDYSDLTFTLSEDFFHTVKVNNKEYLILEYTENERTLITVLDEDVIIFRAVFESDKPITDLSGTNKNKFKNNNEYRLYNIEDNGIRFIMSNTCGEPKESMPLQEYFFDFTDVRNMQETYTASNSDGNLLVYCTEIEYDNNYINLVDLLTKDQKQVYNSFKRVDDIIDYLDKFHNVDSYCEGKEAFIESLSKSKGIFKVEDSNAKTVTIAFMTFMKLEESVTPKGLEKVTVIIPIVVYINYYIESNGLLSQTQWYYESEPYLFKYDLSIDYEKIAEAYNAMDESYLVDDGCEHPNNIFKYTCDPGSANFLGCNAVPTLVDKESKEDLSKRITINSYVDGKERINTTKNKTVTVSVKVKNSANTPAYTNVVTTTIPKGVEVDASSITRNGVYSSENSTVEWKLDYLDAQSTESFSFEINIPNNATDSIYNFRSSITNEDFTSPIESEVVRVNLETGEVNPKTGDIRTATLLFALTVSVALLLFVVHKSSVRNI